MKTKFIYIILFFIISIIILPNYLIVNETESSRLSYIEKNEHEIDLALELKLKLLTLHNKFLVTIIQTNFIQTKLAAYTYFHLKPDYLFTIEFPPDSV